MKEAWAAAFAPFIGERRLEIGSGAHPTPGWTTLDMSARFNPDFVHNLEDLPLPIKDDFFDTVLASHVLEHVDQRVLIPLMYDLARVLKVGGHLIAIVPHGSHSSAWENPLHRQRFTEKTWEYFDRRLYEAQGRQGYCGEGADQGFQFAVWAQVFMSLTPDDPYLGLKDQPNILASYRRTHVDVISEMQVVLRKESM